MRKIKTVLAVMLCMFLTVQLIPSNATTIKAEEVTIGESVDKTDGDSDKAGSQDTSVQSKARAATVTITDIVQLESFFPDDIFREVVFKAVKDGQDGAEGADVEEALFNFRGSIKYNKSLSTPSAQKIKDVHGIQYLRNAELVSLKYNEIRDFSFLNKATEAEKEHYGDLLVMDTTIPEDARNVEWDFAGNPFEKLPASFGGRLKIKQPGASSYTYPLAPENTHIYVRSEKPIQLKETGTINIHKTDIFNAGGKARDAKVVDSYTKLETAIPGDHGPLMIHINKFDDNTANYTFEGTVDKSENYYVYVGLDEELKYWTKDEYAGITSGAQSFKYYIPTAYLVYDRIETSTVRGDHARLTKTDSKTGDPVQGAAYDLYQINDDGSETLINKNIVTDDNGQLSTPGLFLGKYYLKESKAPAGYLLNDEKIPFEITKNADQTTGVPRIILKGGEDSITTSDGKTITADTNKREKLFAGGLQQDAKTTRSTDFTYETENVGVGDVLRQVFVTYDKLETEGEHVTRSFSTIDEAITDINKEKNENNIRGSVKLKGDYMVHDSTTIDVITTDTPFDTAKKTSVDVEKKWVDNGNTQAHPDITINLLQNGKVVKNQVLKNGDTKYTFDNLPATDSAGNAYTYSVTEEATNGYKSSIKGSEKDGFVITNTYIGKEAISISGKKIWNDNNDAKKARPDNVVIDLYQNDVKINTIIIREKDDWKYSFKYLPKVDKNDKAYTYTVKESNVAKGYSAKVDGYDITNTYDGGNTPNGDDKKNNPDTGDATQMGMYVFLLIAGFGIMLFAKRKVSNNK